MCGIIGVHGRNVAPIIAKSLANLEYRGYDSAGIALLHGDRLEVIKEIGKPSEVAKDWGFANRPGDIGIGHVRWATHGGVTDYNAHPHWACTADFAVVHNGIIENWEELRKQLESEGHRFSSECDTEVVAHLLEADKGEDLYARLLNVRKLLKGQYAIAAISRISPNCIVAARNGSPFVFGIGMDYSFVASDFAAMPDGFTGQTYVLGEASAICILGYGHYRLVGSDRLAYVSNTVHGDKGSYPHFMLKEIMEEVSIPRYDLSDYFFMKHLKLYSKILLLGCGSSRYACLMGYYFLLDAGIHTEVVMPSEEEHFDMLCDEKTLVISCSQSGETADVLSAVRIAKSKGAEVVSVVNREHSQLEQLADGESVYLQLGPEMSVAATKSFLAQALVFHEMAMEWQQVSGWDDKPWKKVENSIKRNQEKTKELGEYLKTKEHLYYIGKGPWFSLACEGALKVKEVAYIHAEAYRAGELKHGSLALIEQGTPVIALCLDDSTLNSAVEAKARGAWIVGIGPKKESCFDVWFDCQDWIETTPVLHLIGYYAAVAKGLPVDTPRNLAKSVTVG